MAAVPKPEPSDWLKAAAAELAAGDRATLKLLQESYREVNKILKDLPSTPDAAFGNLIYRAQLERTRRALLAEQAKLFDKLGDIVSARRLRSASRASKLSAASDAALLNLVGDGDEGKTLFDGASITSQRTVDTIIARAKLSAVPLAERIYNTKSWMNKRLDTLIATTMAKGLNAQRFAKVARDWFAPSVPGGTRYAAMRLARTEINNAFHATSIVYAGQKPWVQNMEWHLSKSHPAPDICNKVAADSPYLVTAVPRKPHPQCMCYVTEQQVDEDEWIDRFINGEFNDYLDGKLATANAQLGLKPDTPSAPKTKKQQQKPAPAKEPDAVKLPSAAKTVDLPKDSAAVEQSVRQAYVDLAVKPGDEVSIADLRDKLADVPKRDLDQALLKMDRERKIQLEPNPHRINLTARDKAAAIPLGGEDMHLLTIAKKDLTDVLERKDNGRGNTVGPDAGTTGREVPGPNSGGAGQSGTTGAQFDDRVTSAATDEEALAASAWGLSRGELPPEFKGFWARAVGGYTGSWYRSINKLARGQQLNFLEEPDREEAQELLETLDEAFAAVPGSAEEALVFRGILDASLLFGDRTDGDLTGLEWLEQANVSTTAREIRTKVFLSAGASRMRMRILLPKGTKMIQASSRNAEAEVLVKRGERFRIVRDNGVDSAGVRNIDVELIPSK